jgi:hypothetical protein
MANFTQSAPRCPRKFAAPQSGELSGIGQSLKKPGFGRAFDF